jgi:hypothetical protein
MEFVFHPAGNREVFLGFKVESDVIGLNLEEDILTIALGWRMRLEAVGQLGKLRGGLRWWKLVVNGLKSER